MSDWLEKDIDLKDEHGLHMRPAQRIAEVAGKFKAEIRIAKDQRDCNAKSMLDIMEFAPHLVRSSGQLDGHVIFKAKGADAAQALAALATLVNQNFGLDEPRRKTKSDLKKT